MFLESRGAATLWITAWITKPTKFQIGAEPNMENHNRSGSKWPPSKKWQFTFFPQHLCPVRHCGQCEDCLWGMCPWLAPSKEFITIHSTSLEFCQNTVAWFILQTEMPMNQHQFRPRKDFAKQIHLLTARGGFWLKAKDRRPSQGGVSSEDS